MPAVGIYYDSSSATRWYCPHPRFHPQASTFFIHLWSDEEIDTDSNSTVL